MGLNITPIVFYALNTVSSADMNANFTSVVSATRMSGFWNTSNNSAVYLTNEDTSISGSGALQIRPATGVANRGIALSGYFSGATTDAFYTDTANGYGHIINQMNIYPVYSGNVFISGSFFTGSGNGTYSHGCLSTPLYVFSGEVNQTAPHAISAGTPGSTTVQMFATGNFHAMATIGK